MRLLPHPRRLERQAGEFVLPQTTTLYLEPALAGNGSVERLASVLRELDVHVERSKARATATIRAFRGASAAARPEGHTLKIYRRGIQIECREPGGCHAALATLRQLLREHGRRLPCLTIRDYADFPRRGVMLDISRGRVPRLETLMEFAGHIADFKINELQLYTEHTFAYRKYPTVWRDWGALTGEEIAKLDAHCRGLGIELVPNQNSFGHLRYFLEHSPVKKLAEVRQAWPDEGGEFLRRPTTLAPAHPGTLPFLRGLYDELLPNFTSSRFNVGCDETWDLGRGQSWGLCERLGRGRVYLEFLKKIHREIAARGKQMMFWGDIILNHSDLVKELPQNIIALNWGYEAQHPFQRETSVFTRAGVRFYVCPGTSTWMTLIGRHDNAFANLRNAAKAGLKNGAEGYLITDWGDGGHPQPLAVSYLPILYGAALSWCATSCDQKLLAPVLAREVFRDPTGFAGQAALGLGMAHRQFKFNVANLTPFGATVAAPPPRLRELYCRDGLKYYARIPAQNVLAALNELEAQRSLLHRSHPANREAEVLAAELDMAARMAAQSCKYMLWQQAVAAGERPVGGLLARQAVAELQRIEEDFLASWPRRNKGSPDKCAPFLRWRMDDYRRGRLHFPPDIAAGRTARKSQHRSSVP